MTIKIDLNSITKAHNKYTSIKAELVVVSEVDAYISNAKEILADSTDASVNSLVYFTEKHKDFIADLWRKFNLKETQLEKTKATFLKFFEYTKEHYSNKETETKLASSSFIKMQDIILAELKEKGGDDLEFWIGLSKASKTNVKALAPSKRSKQ